jgi:hypothetical protein
MRSELAIQDTLRALGAALKTAKHGESAALVDKAAADLSLSRASIFRKLAELGFDAGRKPRADKDSRQNKLIIFSDELAAMYSSNHRESRRV